MPPKNTLPKRQRIGKLIARRIEEQVKTHYGTRKALVDSLAPRMHYTSFTAAKYVRHVCQGYGLGKPNVDTASRYRARRDVMEQKELTQLATLLGLLDVDENDPIVTLMHEVNPNFHYEKP